MTKSPKITSKIHQPSPRVACKGCNKKFASQKSVDHHARNNCTVSGYRRHSQTRSPRRHHSPYRHHHRSRSPKAERSSLPKSLDIFGTDGNIRPEILKTVREYEAKKEKEKHPSKPGHKIPKVKNSKPERSYSSKVTTTRVKPGLAGDFADIGTEIDVHVSERLSLTPHQDSTRLDQPLLPLESSTENPEEKTHLDQPLLPLESSTENPEE
jgi:hypothetical protein